MKRKGLLNQIMIVVILIVVVISIIAAFSLASIVLPILTGEGLNAANTIQTSIASVGNNELTNASSVATSTTINILGIAEFITYIAFLGLIIGFILVCYYVRTYPFLGFFWAGGIVILVIIAMIMSNAYEQAKAGDLAQFYTTWGTNDLLMSFLPHIIAMIGIIGGIILFALVSTGDEASETRQL